MNKELIFNLNIPLFKLSFLFTLSFVLLLLNDYKLSNFKLIKYIQLISFILLIFYIIYFLITIYFLNYDLNKIICSVNENKDVHLHGHVSVDKETGTALSSGISNIGNNIRLGATVSGVSLAIAKGISKSSIPPLQKAGIIMAGSVLGGAIHVGASTINRKNNGSFTGSSWNNGLNNLIDTGNNISPLETLLECINVISVISLFLLLILSLQLFYKFIINDNPELGWLKFIVSSKYERKIIIWIHKIIKLHKNMNVIWMILTLILLIIAVIAISFFSWELSNNIDSYVDMYIKLQK